MVGFMAFMAFLALGLSHCPDGTAHSRHILQCEPSSCSIAHDEPLDIPRTSKDCVGDSRRRTLQRFEPDSIAEKEVEKVVAPQVL